MKLQVARGAVTAPDGLLLVDKSPDMTSHDVVVCTRKLAATRKVGHAGTLDPMATGLLVLGVGRATRFLTYLVGADKTYLATVRLGQETLTEDAEGEITAAQGCPETELASLPARIETALDGLRGKIQQVPSAVSAIKIDGVRSYKRVRDGEDVQLAARPVTIHALALLGAPRPETAADGTAVVDIDLTVTCSSGTYVRALARDLGQALGCGAHLTALRRTAVGPFNVHEGRELADWSAQVEADGTGENPAGLAVMSLSDAARRCFHTVNLDERETGSVRRGQFLDADVLARATAPERPIASKAGGETLTAGFAPDSHVVALLSKKGRHARPVLVLDPA